MFLLMWGVEPERVCGTEKAYSVRFFPQSGAGGYRRLGRGSPSHKYARRANEFAENLKLARVVEDADPYNY